MTGTVSRHSGDRPSGRFVREGGCEEGDVAMVSVVIFVEDQLLESFKSRDSTVRL